MTTGERYFPAKFVDTTTLRRINEKARTAGYGPAALPRLFEDAHRTLLHVGNAVSFDRMQGRESPLTDDCLEPRRCRRAARRVVGQAPGRRDRRAGDRYSAERLPAARVDRDR
jgi:hypothetical protein